MTELTHLEIWLPARLVNSLNRREHWGATAKRARIQRDAVALAVHQALGRTYRIAAPPSWPKVVTFEARVGTAFDDDGLRAALKHVRDGLIDAGLIHGDAPRDGHTFTYLQRPGTPRPERGVQISVALGVLGSRHGGLPP